MARSFALDIKAFAEKAGKNADQIVRKVGIEMATRLVRRTPVDTGRARANWITTTGTPSAATTEATDKSGGQSIANATAALATAKAGQTVFISNNLPYIEELEDGSSKQAPAGMAAVTVVEFQSIVANAAREITP